MSTNTWNKQLPTYSTWVIPMLPQFNFSIKELTGGKVKHIIPKNGWKTKAATSNRGRKDGTNGRGKGGVAWAIYRGINDTP